VAAQLSDWLSPGIGEITPGTLEAVSDVSVVIYRLRVSRATYNSGENGLNLTAVLQWKVACTYRP
jgi:hypothetical protein